MIQPSESGIIFRIKKYAIHDGPGIRTTVFLKGCPLSCPWCHNPEGIRPEPEPLNADGAAPANPQIIGKRTTIPEIMAAVKKDIIFYDESGGGVTFSGGEPLSQPEFLKSLLAACRDQEIHTAIDTSGCAPPEVFSELSGMADLLLFDLKIIDPLNHVRHTGKANDDILRNLTLAAEQRIPLRIRFPLIPGITDPDDNIKAIAELLDSLKTIRFIDILPFHRTAEGKYDRLRVERRLSDTAPPSNETIRDISLLFTDYGFIVNVGG